MSLFELKKWYFDVITDGGDVLCAGLAVYRWLGMRRACLSARLVTLDGRQVGDSLTVPIPRQKNEDRIEVAGHFFEKGPAGHRLFLDLPRLRVDLDYAPAGNWHPNGKGVLVRTGRQTLGWKVPLFRAAVRGTLRAGGERLDAGGTGYHDLIWADMPPWRLPAGEVVWGRAHFPSASLVWNQLTTREGVVLQNILLKRDAYLLSGPGGNASGPPRPRWIDDYQFRLEDPGEAASPVIAHPAFSLLLTEKRALAKGPASTAERIAWPPLLRTLAGLAGRPEGRKAVSEARLEMGESSQRGLALHERVVWTWKKARGLKG